jgi:2-dehydro-3-deoxyphosphogalactonate aldolase
MNGIIAILRGVVPDEVLPMGRVLESCGVGCIEVPLNSPHAFASIEALAREFGARLKVGAGTVMTAAQVNRVADAGAQLVLSPHLDADVVHQTKARGLYSMPGVATPTEGFAALRAGADALKLFPSELLGTAALRAWAAVLPAGTPMFSVGGIDVDNIGAFKAAGASGVGVGSSLYVPGMAVDELASRARALIARWSAA